MIGGLIAAGALSSCKLPPREALSEIQRDTLLGYLAGNHERHANFDHLESMIPPVEEGPAFETSPMVVEEFGPYEIPTIVGSSFGTPGAEAVPDKPGYVYSPHTMGRLMVDVRTFDAGEKVLCPYTRRPFIVPASSGSEVATVEPVQPKSLTPSTTIPEEKAKTTAPAPTKKRVTDPKLASGPSTKPLTPLKKDLPGKETPKVAGNRKTEEKSIDVPEPMRKGAPEAPPKERTAAAGNKAPKPAPKTTDDTLPYGTRIQGKPNFVYSPFAAKNQIVDVSGLAPGTKVRCPYTGKLFRVPAAAKEQPAPAPKKKSSGEGTSPAPKKKPAEKKSTSGRTPVAAWVQGKPGYVKSPHGNYTVDVRGKKPGAVVLCPHTGKPFRVPQS